MRIRRYPSSLTFRPRRRRAGCLPWALLLGLMLGVGALLRDAPPWLLPAAPPPALSLQPALNAFAAGDFATAIDLAYQLYDVQPDNLAVVTLLVRALVYHSYSDYNLGRERRTALELTTETMQRLPFNAEATGLHAFALQANATPIEAGRLALRAIDKVPLNMPARLALSLSYGSQGIFEAALREANRAVEIAQSTAPAWLMDAYRVQAIALGDLGRYQEAISALKQAIAVHRTVPALYFERALYALQIGDSDAATAAYFRVVAFDPDNVKARLRLCELSSTMREREAARRYCQEVTTLAPEWPDGWYALGREYFLSGDFAPAQQALHRCATLQVLQNVPVEQRRFECWYIQGQAAEILGDCPALLATYNEFLTMTAGRSLPQTWVYPPEGPPGCVSATPAS
ncbi:MAG: tetratricopeptide repeat protein [Anaerolineae bacterium]|nr:tetratricopeptide repeat protein [Anaerolineae bacterium]